MELYHNKNSFENIYADVSAIIPCYNCSRTLERAVESIWKQTLKPLEVILVDDYSNDNGNTMNTMLKIEKLYPLDWIHLTFLDYNSGPGNARNVGWNIAKGNYIAFLDSDDAWHKNKIEIQYNLMINNYWLDICGHGFINWDEKDKTVNTSDVRIKSVSLKDMFISNRLYTRTVMLHHRITERFDSEMYRAEDFLLWCCIIANGYKCGVIKQKLAFVFDSDDISLSTNLEKSEQGELMAYRKLYTKGIIGIMQLSIWSIYSLFKYSIRKIRKIFYNR